MLQINVLHITLFYLKTFMQQFEAEMNRESVEYEQDIINKLIEMNELMMSFKLCFNDPSENPHQEILELTVRR